MRLAAIVAVVLAGSVARASNPVAVIAVVDKVVFAPTDDAPTSVHVWGTFVVKQELASEDREYLGPMYGYFAYKAPGGKEADCRKDWNEMRKFAGTGKVLSWGEREREPNWPGKTARVEEYDPAYGLMKFGDNSTFEPVKRLKTVPAPVAPAERSDVPPGKVTLTVRNTRDKQNGWHYVFTLKHGAEEEKSDPVEPGKDETSWVPKTEIKAGVGYSWTVQAVKEKHDTRPTEPWYFQGK
jgi:hypothetical protein